MGGGATEAVGGRGEGSRGHRSREGLWGQQEGPQGP